MTIDARKLKEPIICSVEDIQPVHMSRDNSRAAAQLRAVAERNNTARQRAVTGLLRMTGKAKYQGTTGGR